MERGWDWNGGSLPCEVSRDAAEEDERERDEREIRLEGIEGKEWEKKLYIEITKSKKKFGEWKKMDLESD